MLGFRIATVAAVAAALTSCSGGSSGPGSLPTLSPLPSATSTPTASSASLTPQSAADFARHWYAEITRAWAERDPSPIAALSAPGCKACERYVTSISSVRRKGERVDGVTFNLTLVQAQVVVGGRTRVAILYDSPASRRYDASGRLLDTEAAVKGYEEELQLVARGSSWLVEQDTAT